jgi:two-component system sensor histidine kinase BaeS
MSPGRSLRTRLFLTTGAVLAASIAASGLLSRRATLVEVREVVSRPAPAGGFERVASDVAAAVAVGGTPVLQAMLDEQSRILGRPLVVVDAAGSGVAASSSAALRAARVRRTSSVPGDVDLEFAGPAGVNSIAVRGAPARELLDPHGRSLGFLLAFPVEADGAAIRDRDLPGPGIAPAWIVVTAGVAVAGLILTFALSRHILRPVGELTDAVRRMESGDLGARAERAARRNDEIGRLAGSFNTLAARLAEHERARRQMVADVAHELRSPVTNLRCTVEALQDGLAAPDRATIDALHDEIMFLQRVVADLQDLTLAEGGRLTLHLEAVDVRTAVERAVSSTTTTTGPAVAVDIPEDLPPALADASRLEQVLRNLISNARRHAGDTGPVTVRAFATTDRVRIEVSDRGTGMAPEHLPHVFDRFYRADGSRSRSTGGAGLGLAIVRQLVEAQRGSVEAVSEGPGQGATFSVELPRHRAAGR